LTWLCDIIHNHLSIFIDRRISWNSSVHSTKVIPHIFDQHVICQRMISFDSIVFDIFAPFFFPLLLIYRNIKNHQFFTINIWLNGTFIFKFLNTRPTPGRPDINQNVFPFQYFKQILKLIIVCVNEIRLIKVF